MKVWLVTKQRLDWDEYETGPAEILRGYDNLEDASIEQSKLMNQRKPNEKYPSDHPINYKIETTEIYMSEYTLVPKQVRER